MKRITLILIACLVPLALFATPDPTGKSGTYTHGSRVTITGTGFLTKTTPGPALFDKVEGTYSTSITDGGVVPVRTAYGGGPQEAGAPFQYNADGHNHVRFETTAGEQRSANSTACYKTDGTGGAWLSNTETAPIIGARVDFSYISWWVKSGSTWANPSGPSQKLLRMCDHELTAGGSNTFSWVAYPNDTYIWIPDATPACGASGQTHASTPWSSGWHFMEGIFDNANKVYTLRMDNVDIVTNKHWSCDFNFNAIQCIGWDTERDNEITAIDVWWDDIYFDGSASRVMIGDASTYSACTHFEMQPPTAWANDSITVTLNRGSFGATDTAYIYVFDSANAYNSSGLPITFGDEEEPPADTTPPTVTISTSDPTSSTTSSISIAWTDSDDTGVTSRKWRIGAAPDATHGTEATSPATITGLQPGDNTVYIGAGDAAGNWGSDSITVNYNPVVYRHIGGSPPR